MKTNDGADLQVENLNEPRGNWQKCVSISCMLLKYISFITRVSNACFVVIVREIAHGLLFEQSNMAHCFSLSHNHNVTIGGYDYFHFGKMMEISIQIAGTIMV